MNLKTLQNYVIFALTDTSIREKDIVSNMESVSKLFKQTDFQGEFIRNTLTNKQIKYFLETRYNITDHFSLNVVLDTLVNEKIIWYMLDDNFVIHYHINDLAKFLKCNQNNYLSQIDFTLRNLSLV